MLPYVDDQHSNPKLRGILWHIIPAPSPRLSLVATNGHRLAKCDITPDDLETSTTSPAELILFKRTILVLLELANSLPIAEPWLVTCFRHHMTFTLGHASLSTALIAGPAINYQQSLPTTDTFRLCLSSQPFYHAVRRISAVTTTSDHPITITPKQHRLLLSTHDHLVGEGTDVLDIEGATLPEPMTFHTQYLLDLLQGFEHESIIWSGTSGRSPSSFTSPTTPSLRFVIMPIARSSSAPSPSKEL